MFIPEKFEAPQEVEADFRVSRTDALVLGAMALLAVCVAFAPWAGHASAAHQASLPWDGLIIALLLVLSLGLACLMARHTLKQKRLVKLTSLNLAIAPDPVFSKTS